MLEFNQYQKSDKAPFIIYADLECLMEKIDKRKNNPESDVQKIQLTIATNFISSKDNDEERVMHSKSNNKAIKINDNPEEVIEVFE